MSTPVTEQAAALQVEATSRALHLPTVRQQANALAEAALRDRLTHLAYLAEVLSAELDDRDARRRERRIHEARFPRLKHLADFDLAAAPTVDPTMLATLERFEPEDLNDRFGWLFTDVPRLIEDLGGWRERQDTLRETRVAAATRVYEEAGLPGLIRLARSVEHPGMLGDVVGRSSVGVAQEDELLHDHLAAADPALAYFARGFASGRCAAEGRSWAEDKLRGVASTWMPQQQAELLLAMPYEPATWDLVEAFGTAVETRYWRAVHPWTGESDGFERAIESLLRYDRPFLAADLVGMHLHSAPADAPHELCARVLERCLAADGEQDRPGAGFRSDVGSILDALEAATFDPARVARIELGFLRLMRFERPPRTLHAELSRSPAFFVEVVAAAFRAEGEDEPREEVVESPDVV